MTNQQAKSPLKDPLVTLTAEARQHILDMTGEIERLESDLAGMEELGFDVTRLRERIEWAKKAKAFILKSLEGTK